MIGIQCLTGAAAADLETLLADICKSVTHFEPGSPETDVENEGDIALDLCRLT